MRNVFSRIMSLIFFLAIAIYGKSQTDFLFIVDNSGSISPAEFNQFADIIMTTGAELDQSCPNANFAIVHYGGAYGADITIQNDFIPFGSTATITRVYPDCVSSGTPNCGDDLHAAFGNIINDVNNGNLNPTPGRELIVVIFTDADGNSFLGPNVSPCSFPACSTILPYTNFNMFITSFPNASSYVIGIAATDNEMLLAGYLYGHGQYYPIGFNDDPFVVAQDVTSGLQCPQLIFNNCEDILVTLSEPEIPGFDCFYVLTDLNDDIIQVNATSPMFDPMGLVGDFQAYWLCTSGAMVPSVGQNVANLSAGADFFASGASQVTITDCPQIGLSKELIGVSVLSNGEYLIEFDFVIENFSNLTLNGIELYDDIIGQFAGLIPHDFMASSTDLNINPAWNGSATSNILISGQTLAPFASATISIKFEIVPDGFTTFVENSAEVCAYDDSAVQTCDDSTDGPDPDPNDDDDPEEDDPTPVPIPPFNPEIGLAKDFVDLQVNSDGSYTISFLFTIENYSQFPLNNAVLTDDIVGQFAGLSPSNFTTSFVGNTIPTNPSWSGMATDNILDNNVTIAPYSVEMVSVQFDIIPDGITMSVNNVAMICADAPNNMEVCDDSTDGLDPDPNDDDDPEEDDPTMVPLPPVEINIGLAKDVAEVSENADGSYYIEFLLTIENLSFQNINDLAIYDWVALQFDGLNPTNFNTTFASNTLNTNPSWDGSAQSDILLPGQTIAPLSTEYVRISFTVTPNGFSGCTTNTALIVGVAENGLVISDTSTFGLNPDPNSDLNPNESEATCVYLDNPSPTIGLAKNLSEFIDNGDGSFYVEFQFVIENFGDVVLQNMVLTDNIVFQFAGQQPSDFNTIFSSNTIVTNANWNGTSTSNILQGGQDIQPGQSETVSVSFQIIPDGVTDQLLNIAMVCADSPEGDEVCDDSTNGVDPDPNDDDFPEEEAPTPIPLPSDCPEIGLAKSLTSLNLNIDGSYNVEILFTIENLSNVDLTDLVLFDDILGQFAGFQPSNFNTSFGSNTLNTNPNWNGTGSSNVLEAFQTISAGAIQSVSVSFDISHDGMSGSVSNQATIFAVDENITTTQNNNECVVSDVSTNGTDPDPNDDDDPEEDNPTIIPLPPSPTCELTTVSCLLFDLDQCLAVDGEMSMFDYSEFTGEYTGASGAPNFEAVGGHIYRNNPNFNPHSCTPGVSGSAMCVGSYDPCDYDEGNDKAVRFDVLVTPGDFGEGGISCLDFFQSAPQFFNWNDGSWGLNNYPTLYGIRVLVDGQEIYEQIDIPTTQDWSPQNFNFLNISEFTVTEPTVFSFELMAYCTIGNGGIVNAWDLDEIKVSYKESSSLEGGNLVFSNGTTVANLCEGQFNGDITIQLTGEDGPNYGWVLTDMNGNILQIGAQLSDLVLLQSGNFLIWHLAYDDIQGLDIGSNVEDIEGCHDFSNSLEINFLNNPVVNVLMIYDTSCGENNGSISLSVSGGFGDYMYAWSNGSSGNQIDDLAPGTYTVTVTDEGGCTGTASANILPSTAVEVSLTKTNTSCGENNGSVVSNVTGGSGTYSYTWSNGASSSQIANLQPGMYTVTVSDDQGCYDMASVIIRDSESPTVQVQSSNTKCAIDNGSISLNVSGGQVPYEYNWSNGATSNNLNDLSNGTFSYTVTDAAGCEFSGSIDIEESTNPELSFTGSDSTCGVMNGSASVSVSGGIPPYNYNWSNGSNVATINNLFGGHYFVTVTDSDGCMATGSYFVSPSSSPELSLSEVEENCGQMNGSITAMVVNGMSPYTYLWSNGSDQSMISGLAAGSYRVTVTDVKGCSDVASIELGGTSSPSLNLHSEDSSCAENNGSATVSAMGGTSPYSFMWSTGASGAVINNLSAGSYSVTVTDAAGCTDEGMVSIDDSDSPSLVLDVIHTSCGENNGSIGASASGGSGTYSYQWSNGASGNSLNNLIAGNYSVTVTDMEGCMDVENVTINDSSNPMISLTGINTSCGENNGSISSMVNGGVSPYLYSWSNGSTNANITNLSPGTYSVTLTDVNACTTQANIEILNSSNPNVSFNKQNTSCGESNGAIQLNVSGGISPYIYTWSNGSANKDLQNLNPGTYSVTVTDIEGCTDELSVNILGSSSPEIIANIVHTTCGEDNGSVNLSVSAGVGPYSFNWSNGSNTSSVNSLASGAYTVTVTDVNDCTDVMQINIEDSNAVFVSVNHENTSCGENNGAAVASANGGSGLINYMWSTGSTNASINNLTSGIYSVTVTDQLDCTAVESIQVLSSSAPEVTVQINHTSCGDNNGALIAMTSGGEGPYLYQWSNGLSGSALSNLIPGNYTVTVEDVNGCTDISSVMVDDSESPVLTIAGTDTECGESNGDVSTSVTGGNLPYSYNWSNGATASNLNNLSAGNYSLTVTDASGCTDVGTVNVSDSESPTLTLNGTDTSCGNSNGSVIANPSGGNTPYSFDWSNGMSSDAIFDLAPGNYSVTVTDASDCQAVQSYEVLSSIALNANITGTNEICTNSAGSANVVIVSGNQPYSYSWNNGLSGSSIDNLSAGLYVVSITDNEACTEVLDIEILNETDLEIDVQSSNTCCGEDNGMASLTVSCFVDPLNITWSNGDNTSSIENLSPGNYGVTVTDATGQTETYNFVIDDSDSPVVMINGVNTFCGENNGSATASVNLGIAPYSYLWNTGATTETITNLPAGTYTVTVTDDKDCTGTASIVIIGSDVPDAGDLTGGPFDFCVDGNVDFVYGISINGAVGANSSFIVTDESGTILALPNNVAELEMVNFDAAGAGSCFIYHVSYDGNIGLNVSNNISNLSGCFDLTGPIEVLRQIITNSVSVLSFDLDDCAANTDFSEFTAEFNGDLGCTTMSVVGGNLYGGLSHSCTPGVENLGMCFEGSLDCNLDVNTSNKLTIPIQVDPGSNGVGVFSGLSFFEQAPENFVWSDGTTAPNNYPSLFAIRIFKAGSLIYQDLTIPTNLVWFEQNFDFSSNPDFTVNTSTNFTIELIPYCAAGNSSVSNSIWDIDEIEITSNCSMVPEGGVLSGGPYSICTDGVPDYITDLTLTENAGESHSIVVTDLSGEIMYLFQSINHLAIFNFDNAEVGSYQIWNFSASGNFTGLTVGNNLFENINGCYSLSNPIDLILMECGTRISVFPNPSKGLINISFGTPEFEYYKINVIDNLGRVVKSISSTKVASKYVTMDLHELTGGTYSIKIDTDKSTVLKRIVIAK